MSDPIGGQGFACPQRVSCRQKDRPSSRIKKLFKKGQPLNPSPDNQYVQINHGFLFLYGPQAPFLVDKCQLPHVEHL